MPKKIPKTGFTLVELLVVITIITILSAIGLAVYSNAQSLARDSKRLSGIRDLVTALEAYNSSNGSYPGCSSINCSSWGNSGSVNYNHPYIGGLVPNFMRGLPHDPLELPNPGGPDICYVRNSYNGYSLEFRLENKNTTDQTLIYVGTATEAGRTMYRYNLQTDYSAVGPSCT